MERFDVVIVGARCAGAPLGLMLARAGLRVCVLDRARFPSDTPSTHGIQPTGVAVLDRLGIGGRLRQMAPAIDAGVFAIGGARIEDSAATERLGFPMLNLRRVSLDAVLVEEAARAGATVMTQTPMEGLVEEDGRVVGVRTPRGPLRAPLVVGADGTGSSVARLVGAEEYGRTAPGRMFLWAYFEGVPGTGLSDRGVVMVGKQGDHGFLASPTDSGLFMAAVAPSLYRKAEVLADLAGSYTAGLRGWPELDSLAGQGRRVGPIRVMSRWHGYFRRSAGPGWVLVGDAGHFKDPSPGQGIADALRQVEHLAPVIEAGLGGGGLDQAMQQWWAWRDADAWEMYWFAHDMGAPGPIGPVMAEIMARIAADRHLTEQLMRVLNHDLPPSRLIPASLALRAMAAAVVRQPGRRREVLAESAELVSQQLAWRRRIAAHSPVGWHATNGKAPQSATAAREVTPNNRASVRASCP